MVGFLNSWRGHSPIGVHLTPQRICLAQVALEGNAGRIAALATTELPAAVDQLSAPQWDELSSTLRDLLKANGFRGREAIGCLNTSQMYVNSSRFAAAGDAELLQAAIDEALPRLPFDQAGAEFRVIAAGEVRQEGTVKREAILFASRRAAIDQVIRLIESAGLQPQAIDIEPAAVLRCLQPQETENRAALNAYLHLGAAGTTLLFGNGPRMTLVKGLKVGRQQFDDAVAEHLQMPLDQARRLRKIVNAANELDSNSEMHRAVIEAVRPHLASLVNDLELCLRYQRVTFRGQAVQQLIVAGGDASSWLANHLGESLGLPATVGDPFARFGQRGALLDQDEPGRWTVPVGLCLRSASPHAQVA